MVLIFKKKTGFPLVSEDDLQLCKKTFGVVQLCPYVFSLIYFDSLHPTYGWISRIRDAENQTRDHDFEKS
jgi:hypothetical protein